MPRMRMAAGTRNRVVMLQQLVESQGPSGYPVERWELLISLYASKDDAIGSERFSESQLSSPFDTTWQIPYMTSMDPELVNIPKKRRLVYANRVYDIVSASPIGLHRGLELQTLAGGLLT